MAFEDFYNPTTGATWMANTGGWTPAEGWVRGRKPANWTAPVADGIVEPITGSGGLNKLGFQSPAADLSNITESVGLPISGRVSPPSLGNQTTATQSSTLPANYASRNIGSSYQQSYVNPYSYRSSFSPLQGMFGMYNPYALGMYTSPFSYYNRGYSPYSYSYSPFNYSSYSPFRGLFSRYY